MAKGDRTELDDILEVAWKRQRWAREHGKPKMLLIPAPSNPAVIQIVRRIIGITFILAGISLMDSKFWGGYALLVFGFALLIYEVIVEPELKKRARWIRLTVLTGCVAAFMLLTYFFISLRSGVKIVSYSVRRGEHQIGTEIGGIKWNPHLADLQVSITNSTKDDYENVDLAIHPDAWTYKAAIMSSSQGCELMALPRNKLTVFEHTTEGTTRITSTNIGQDTDVNDNSGDLPTTLATDGGYRLRCGTLASESTVQIVFALVTLPSFVDVKAPPPGKKKLDAAVIAGLKSMFDVLGDKPNPKIVNVEGHLKRNKQPFSFESTSPVLDGN